MAGEREEGKKQQQERKKGGRWRGTEREEAAPHREGGRGSQKGLKGREKEECWDSDEEK